MNKVFLVGRLTRDPELRYSANNMPIMRCSIAVNRTMPNQNGEREADFINILAFNNRAETMKKYLSKGSQIAIAGQIRTGSYDAQDGTKRYTTDVLVDEFQFLDSKSSRDVDGGFNQFANPSPAPAPTSAPSTPSSDITPYDFADTPVTSSDTTESDPFKDFGDSIEINDSDLPF